MTAPTSSYVVNGMVLSVGFKRMAWKWYHGLVIRDVGGNLEYPIESCAHHHHSKGSARDCAKRLRARLRRDWERIESYG